MDSIETKIKNLLQQKRAFSTAEANEYGISRQMLAHYCRQGKIERICRGIYSPVQTDIVQYPELEVLAQKKIDFVVCLISALQMHEFTTQLANSLWIAVKRGTHVPDIGFPLNCIYLTDSVYSYGIEEHKVNGYKIKVYSPAKTVADCFKFRNKIGLDVALEALKEGHRSKLFTATELYNAAKVCHVANIIRPYEELIQSYAAAGVLSFR